MATKPQIAAIVAWRAAYGGFKQIQDTGIPAPGDETPGYLERVGQLIDAALVYHEEKVNPTTAPDEVFRPPG